MYLQNCQVPNKKAHGRLKWYFSNFSLSLEYRIYALYICLNIGKWLFDTQDGMNKFYLYITYNIYEVPTFLFIIHINDWIII